MTQVAKATYVAFTILFFIINFNSAIAAGLKKPEGPVILTVSGLISNTNGDGVALYDKDLIAEIGISEINTSTTWTDGKNKFIGVLGRDLLKAVGAKGTEIFAVAVNDYKITIPISDFNKYDVLLATSMNGKVLTRRDKGPIWVVYPRDDHSELQTETINGRMIWQLVKIVVK
jgi:hypothetical protein